MALHPALRSLLDVPAVSSAPATGTAAALLRSAVVEDTALPGTETPLPLTVTLTGGAAQLGGPAAYCARAGLPLLAVRTGLRDLDDLVGNARRVTAAVDAARADGSLAEETAVHVALPAAEATYSWLAAADELAAAELGLALPVAGVPAPVLAGWLDAALDRELPFTCTRTSGRARAGGEGPGFLDLLAATVRCFDGAAPSEVADALAGRPEEAPDLDELARVRRWLVGVDAPDAGAAGAAGADLDALGLLDPPA